MNILSEKRREMSGKRIETPERRFKNAIYGSIQRKLNFYSMYQSLCNMKMNPYWKNIVRSQQESGDAVCQSWQRKPKVALAPGKPQGPQGMWELVMTSPCGSPSWCAESSSLLSSPQVPSNRVSSRLWEMLSISKRKWVTLTYGKGVSLEHRYQQRKHEFRYFLCLILTDSGSPRRKQKRKIFFYLQILASPLSEKKIHEDRWWWQHFYCEL